MKLVLLLMEILFLFSVCAAAQVREVRRVLVFNELGPWSPGIAAINNEIFAVLEKSSYQIEFYSEDLDSSLFPDEAPQSEFRDWYFHKYRNRKPDLIIAVTPTPINFMTASHKLFSPGTPIVFWGSTEEFVEPPKFDSDFTGVGVVAQPHWTLDAALRPQPGTQHVVSAPLVTSAANAPVFAMDDVDVGTGAMGGDVFTFSLAGQVAAGMAVRTLSGGRPQDIPIVRGSNIYMFDWRALKRLGLKEADFAPGIGSIVLNRTPMVRESYKFYIIVGIALILGETLLILGLLWQRARARKAEDQLAISNDWLRLAVKSGKSIGWDWELKTGRQRLFGDLQTVLGIESDTHTGQVGDFRRTVHPEDRELVQQAIVDAQRTRNPYTAEFRIIRTDGAVRWINATGKFDYARNGDPERMFGIAVDITDRKEAECNVRESEERFRLVANNTPVMIWMSGTDKVFNYFNQPWLDFAGRSTVADLGNSLVKMVHLDDLELRQGIYARAFERREPFRMEYRLQRHDGEYRWLLDHGVPRFESDGSFAGYIGSCIDVTDRKQAEEALATVGRRLIEAHEEERTWIARELHDDINQRLAVFAYELDQWGTDGPVSAVRSDHLRRAQESLNEIATDIQSLSHRLHSSRLDILGLTAAAKSFCRELSEKAKVEIAFSHTEIPSTLTREVSLCLFRVMQEALQNAVKHSGVLAFKVHLSGTPDSVELIVADSGCGFEEQSVISRQGLGLISMRERLQMVHGELKIQSKSGVGTTIYGRVPLKGSHAGSNRATPLL